MELICPNCGRSRLSKVQGRANKLGHQVTKFEALSNWVTIAIIVAAPVVFAVVRGGDISQPTTWIPFALIFSLVGSAMAITVLRTVPAILYKCRDCGAAWALRSHDAWPPTVNTTKDRN